MKTIEEIKSMAVMDEYSEGQLKALKNVLKLIDKINDWKNPKKTWDGIKSLNQFKKELKSRIKGK